MLLFAGCSLPVTCLTLLENFSLFDANKTYWPNGKASILISVVWLL